MPNSGSLETQYIPPRTIRRDTRVFISAVTRELGSVRKLVKKGLEDNDYHAVEQDNFPPDYRDLVDKLRERIDSCDAVVHIAGHCYGAEPLERPPDAPDGATRSSSTTSPSNWASRSTSS